MVEHNVTRETAYCYLKLTNDQRIEYRRLLDNSQRRALAEQLRQIHEAAQLASEIVRREIR